MLELESHLCGRWQRGAGRGEPLVNPSTEEPLGTAASEGLDLAAALAWARDRGGPALRSLTFAERGELLRGLSRALHAHRDELIGLAIQNGGNTRGDAKFDIDGASGTLAAYADLGASLGAARVLADGEALQLSRSPRLAGRHLLTPRRGVAVHVNAFNFPAWGLAEKAAVALLAGVPVLSKPATSTALVAWRIARIFADEKLLPEGALSFLAGGPAGLLDALGPQDALAFTGGSATAAKIRAHPAFVERGARLNVEADSLNVAILGPDVEEGSEVLDLFLADVARDVTQKAGQKCTAIRRAYVPAGKVEVVVERLRERLQAVRVGDPADESTGMGPLATARQAGDVREGLAALAQAAKLVTGGGRREGKGYFVAPTLLVSERPAPGDAVHTREVFGPAATVVPYDGTAAQAAERAAWGGGGLVGSVYSDDRAFLAEAVLELAPHHGRLTLGSAKVAAQALPPGMVLPLLVHGGPGRAGGGEELGGLRGLAFYQQRTALQGDRALLDAIVGKAR
ncbi:MAG: 3,4-dehydroadipyl-CoA semialdehyde dehydrogenase [Deltaproteobacteria bacterium]|nr:3,4-dehydroadipyl-CoA semialdehyde dehydrogenase [Deltaproteobacteria bacterium]